MKKREFRFYLLIFAQLDCVAPHQITIPLLQNISTSVHHCFAASLQSVASVLWLIEMSVINSKTIKPF
jgi:hypothetical protein